jgi:hypothetical protein
MCSRRSCCGQSGGQGTGIAAAAVIIVAAVAAAKTGPVVAKVTHVAVEVLRIAALTAVTVVVAAVLAWVTVQVTRWWLRHRHAIRQKAPQLVITDVPDCEPHGIGCACENCPDYDELPVGDTTGCLGCGGRKTVLRAIDGGRYQADACPVCTPAERAG